MASTELIVTEQPMTVAVANFTNGQIKEKNLGNIKTAYFTSTQTDPKKRKQRILVSETDRLSYVGKNFGPSSSRMTQMCRYYVGVRDKESGKMRICDAEIFNMLPHVPGQDVEDQIDGFNDNADTTEISRTQKIDLLTGAFGSSKKKRAMESRQKLKVKGEALEQALSSAVGHALTQDFSQYSQNETDHSSDTIPPYDIDAKRAEDVYSLDDIISSVEMDAITNHAKELYDCTPDLIQEWSREEKYPKYILRHLNYLPVSEEARWKKVKYLKYLHFMIQLYHYKYKDLKRKHPLPQEWPDSIKNQLLSRFTLASDEGTHTVRSMPAKYKDKLICYILVLCLILEECSLEVSDLLVDLKLGLKRMQTLLRILGCQVKSQKLPGQDSKLEVITATLSVPLTFPKPLSPRKKKDRR